MDTKRIKAIIPKYLLTTSILIVILTSCEQGATELKSIVKKSPGIEEGSQISAYISTGGKMKARLTAPIMKRYMLDTPKVEFPSTLHVDFYDSLTIVDSKLDAHYGSYFENDNKVFLKDNVVFTSRRQDTMWCEELYWDQVKAIFYTDKPTVISQHNPRQKIYAAKGLRASQDLTWFTLNKVGNIHTGKENFLNVKNAPY